MNFEAIKKAAQDYRPAMVKFLRDMIAIPSESCQEEGVVRRIAQEMESLGYDKVEFDKLGNVIGWMGTGDKIIALDSHIDTVGIGMSTPSGAAVSAVPLPDIPEFTAVERMNMEKDTTGLYLSGHPMEDYRPLAKRAGAVPIHAIMSDFEGQDGPKHFADGQNVTVAGVITASRTRTTKNNTLMAYVTIEDELASMELLCFSRVIDQCGSYMQVNTPVLVKGRLSVRDEKPPQIMCDSLYPLESGLPPMEQPSRRPTQRESTIYLRFPSADSPAFRHIKLVMTMFEGSTPVKIRLADTGKLLGTHCLNHPALLQECREWLGNENVVVKEK